MFYLFKRHRGYCSTSVFPLPKEQQTAAQLQTPRGCEGKTAAFNLVLRHGSVWCGSHYDPAADHWVSCCSKVSRYEISWAEERSGTDLWEKSFTRGKPCRGVKAWQTNSPAARHFVGRSLQELLSWYPISISDRICNSFQLYKTDFKFGFQIFICCPVIRTLQWLE